jgi:hypothetical protein
MYEGGDDGEYEMQEEDEAMYQDGRQESELRRSADMLVSEAGDSEFGNDPGSFEHANSPSRDKRKPRREGRELDRGQERELDPTLGAGGDVIEENHQLKEENQMLREQLDSALEMVMRYKQLLKER